MNVVQKMGLTARTAENRFREILGHSIRDEIIAVRVAKAKKLLADPYIMVNSIYAQCGYNDERSLRWVFTKATGLSPSAWRKHHQR
jgi:transcriptional regulator GlxA family with amidase domain